MVFNKLIHCRDKKHLPAQVEVPPLKAHHRTFDPENTVVKAAQVGLLGVAIGCTPGTEIQTPCFAHLGDAL
jgi:hypothetical protein